VYVNIVYSALYDLSEGSPSKYSFEMFLFLFMIASIILGNNMERRILRSSRVFFMCFDKFCMEITTTVPQFLSTVQVLFIVYSLVYSNDIFEIAHERGCPKNHRYK
jgi:hypothetical protein